jgi:hypothetical protein
MGGRSLPASQPVLAPIGMAGTAMAKQEGASQRAMKKEDGGDHPTVLAFTAGQLVQRRAHQILKPQIASFDLCCPR